MSCHTPKKLTLLLCICTFLVGCYPSQPMYLRDTGDLSYYLNQATEIEYPDVETTRLNEVENAGRPITVVNADFQSFYDLTLENCVAIALQNTKTIRGYGTPGLSGTRVNPGIDNLSNGVNGAGTLWNVAIRETEPGFIGTPGQIGAPGSITTNTGLDGNQGVESALADFDAQLTSNLFWSRTDEPRNVVPNFSSFEVFQQDQVTWQTELLKKTANGTQLFFRNVNSYTDNNVPLVTDQIVQGFQVRPSFFRTALEAEIRQPLLRGRGAFIQRMPIVVSRIGTDQEIANLEAQIQNLVTNVEIRYWELHCAYRNLEASKTGRNAALETWRIVKDQFDEGADVNIQQVAQAGEQYHFFDEQVIDAFNTLLTAERNLRWLLGLASTDCKIIRPTDEPVMAPIEFDFCGCKSEALCYRPELRQTRWEVKKRELALAYSKNGLLPEFNLTMLYRWLGLGDDLVNYDGDAPDFPNDNSGAFNEIFNGNYQEFTFGGEFRMPVGYRRELANVRNAQLKLARERNRLEEQELDIVRELEDAVAQLDANRVKMQKSFNRWAKTTIEEKHFEELTDAGVETLDVALDAQRRRAQAEVSFYTSLCEYNKMIALIHRRKGTILAYNGVCFAEGPWTDKAYHDATNHARRRGASEQLNYGWTRPEVISQGGVWPASGAGVPVSTPVEQSPIINNVMDAPMYSDPMPGMVQPMTPTELNYAPGESIQGQPLPEAQNIPITPPANTSTNNYHDSGVRQAAFEEVVDARPEPSRAVQPRHIQQLPKRDVATAPRNTTPVAAKPIPHRNQPVVKSNLNWEKLGLNPPDRNSNATRATIKHGQ